MELRSVLIASLPSANSGLVGGKDWARWDPEGYAATLKTYLKFVHAGFLGKCGAGRDCIEKTDVMTQKKMTWWTEWLPPRPSRPPRMLRPSRPSRPPRTLRPSALWRLRPMGLSS
jgi:hypothetical protein